MIRSRRAAAAALAMMLAATPVLAAAPQTPESKARPRRTTGEVVSVNPAARTVVVRDGGRQAAEITFHLAPDARVVVGREAADLAALHPGLQVRVTYTSAEGRRVASRIAVVDVQRQP